MQPRSARMSRENETTTGCLIMSNISVILAYLVYFLTSLCGHDQSLRWKVPVVPKSFRGTCARILHQLRSQERLRQRLPRPRTPILRRAPVTRRDWLGVLHCLDIIAYLPAIICILLIVLRITPRLLCIVLILNAVPLLLFSGTQRATICSQFRLKIIIIITVRSV